MHLADAGFGDAEGLGNLTQPEILKIIKGKHLALQCHVEVNTKIVRSWCSTGEPEIAASHGPAVQSTLEMQRELDARLSNLHRVANRLYGRWVAGLQL